MRMSSMERKGGENLVELGIALVTAFVIYRLTPAFPPFLRVLFIVSPLVAFGTSLIVMKRRPGKP